MSALRILIVEDEAEFGEALRRQLQHLGHEVAGPAPSCSAALELIWANAPDLAFVDTHLGVETCEAVVDECRLLGIPIVVTHMGEAGGEPGCGGQQMIDKSYTPMGVRDALNRRLAAR